MKSFLALIMLLAVTGVSCAGAIRNGATMQVKADSIWFQDAARLTRWQALKKSGNAAAFSSYQDSLLRSRDAWQFLNPLDVKIRSYQPRTHRVDVEMKTAGRMQGSTWVLDAGALAR